MSDEGYQSFDYALPPERIAQQPAPRREDARLLLLPRREGPISHARIADLPDWLESGDLLVLNATRVLPARLRGAKASGGRAEALVLGRLPGAPDEARWRALVRCRGRLRVGLKLHFAAPGVCFDAEVAALRDDGEVVLAMAPEVSPYAAGEMPLPPYIRREGARPDDVERYQTVYAREPGSVAAPTAGLHLSEPLLDALARKGVERAELLLHVGPGTFRPLDANAWARGRLHAEPYVLPDAVADAVTRTRQRGGRVLAVGTTSARVLEACADDDGRVHAGAGETDLFLRPGVPFRVVDALFTNFHLPRSSLLLLVAAFAGRRRVLDAYAEAIRREYRFYSYGDAMLIF